MDYKDLRSIQETYNAMYSEEVVEEGLAGMVDKATKAGQAGLERMGVKINRAPKPTARPSATTSNTMRQNQSSMEEVDVFDIVKGHLIDEGATEEEALKVMLSLTKEDIDVVIKEVDGSNLPGATPPRPTAAERQGMIKHHEAEKAKDKAKAKPTGPGSPAVMSTSPKPMRGQPSQLSAEAYVVTAADKAGNTPAYQNYLKGMKNKKTGEPLYKAAPHLKGV